MISIKSIFSHSFSSPRSTSDVSLMELLCLPVEILEVICIHLGPNDLHSCVSVNHAFYDTFIPRLWRNISIYQIERYHQFRTPEARAGLAKHGRHVRSIHTIYFKTLQQFLPEDGHSPPCTHLQCLDLMDLREINDPGPMPQHFFQQPQQGHIAFQMAAMQTAQAAHFQMAAMQAAQAAQVAAQTQNAGVFFDPMAAAPFGQTAPFLFGQGAAVPFGQGAAVPFGQGAAVPFGQGAAVPFGQGAAVPFGQGAVVPFGQGSLNPLFMPPVPPPMFAPNTHPIPSQSFLHGASQPIPAPVNLRETLLGIIGLNKDLATLKIATFLPGHEDILEGLCENFPSRLRELDVSIRRGQVHARLVKRLLETCARTIQTITLRIFQDLVMEESDLEEYQGQGEAVLGHDVHPHPSLCKIDLQFPIVGLEEYLLLPFLKGCTSLKSIVTENHACFVNDPVRAVLGDLGVGLESINAEDLSTGDTIQDVTMARIIQGAGPRLKKLFLGGCELIGNRTAMAILENCQSLKEIDLQCCSGFLSRDMMSILCTASELGSFQANAEEEDIRHTDPFLEAQDIILESRPWVCQSLQVFNVEIRGIPRPDITIGVDGRPLDGRNGVVEMHTGSVEDSRRIQRLVYERIGRLKKLKKLCLGHDNTDFNGHYSWMVFDDDGTDHFVDTGFQQTCLEFSLESGLGLLAGLKELEMLDLRRMAHRIGVPELEWMKENWPKLKRLGGMYQDWHYPVEHGAMEWIKANKPEWIGYVEEWRWGTYNFKD